MALKTPVLFTREIIAYYTNMTNLNLYTAIATIAFLSLVLILECFTIGFPNWVKSTDSQNFDPIYPIDPRKNATTTITSGLFAQCRYTTEVINDLNLERTDCHKYELFSSEYDISTRFNAFPEFFLYTRYSTCLCLILTVATLGISVANHPKFWKGSFATFYLAGGLMILSGVLGITAGSWFIDQAKRDRLFSLIGPGCFNRPPYQETKPCYEPDWCLVLSIVFNVFMVIAGCGYTSFAYLKIQ